MPSAISAPRSPIGQADLRRGPGCDRTGARLDFGSGAAPQTGELDGAGLLHSIGAVPAERRHGLSTVRHAFSAIAGGGDQNPAWAGKGFAGRRWAGALRLDCRDVLIRFANTKGDRRTPVRSELGDGIGIAVQPFVANSQLEEHLRIGRRAHRPFQLGRSLRELSRLKEAVPLGGRGVLVPCQSREPESQERDEWNDPEAMPWKQAIPPNARRAHRT